MELVALKIRRSIFFCDSIMAISPLGSPSLCLMGTKLGDNWSTLVWDDKYLYHCYLT